jgi:RNA polymerase sigma-70 factor (ECF subfamily)
MATCKECGMRRPVLNRARKGMRRKGAALLPPRCRAVIMTSRSNFRNENLFNRVALLRVSFRRGAHLLMRGGMSQAFTGAPRPLEQYREYLHLLARTRFDPRMRRWFDPSDIVQQSLLAAHQKLDQFHGVTEAQFLGWLRAILANQIALAVRKLQLPHAQARSLNDTLDQSSARLEAMLAAEQSSPNDQALQAERLLELAKALARLPQDQRTAVELRYLHGLSVTDVAAEMSRSTVSVTGLLYRGIKGLRAVMGESA